MSLSIKNRQSEAGREQRLTLLWLLFLWAIVSVLPAYSTASESTDCADQVTMPKGCGGMDGGACAPVNCDSAPELPELGAFVVPSEKLSSTARAYSLLPASPALLYVVGDSSEIFVSPRLEREAQPLFVPLRVMGPAYAAHAPPVV